MSLRERIRDALDQAVDAAGYGGSVPLILEKPREKRHGDICTPIALSLAKAFKKNPMMIAEEIANAAPEVGEIEMMETAKPGYVNIRFSLDALVKNVFDISQIGDDYGRSEYGQGEKCQVEYVSANPTGPLVVVSARAAAVGSVIVNLLKAVGYQAEGEYYVNDYGNQVRALGESLRYRVREIWGTLGEGEELGAYPGDYLRTVAASVSREQAKAWDSKEEGVGDAYGSYATDSILAMIREDLDLFGVRFDSFFRESTLHPQRVKEALEIVEEKGFAYPQDGAVFFRTTEFSDEKDRVLVKKDGNPTYFLGDIAYHRTKLERHYKWVIDLLGPDHHGHIPRMKAAAAVLGADDNWFQAIVVGWVRLIEGGKPVSMSKRAGEFISLRELTEEVTPDVAKYFFLMRRAHTPLDFDLDLAKKQSDENPVYYVQYAHARIASVVRFAQQKQLERPDGATAYRELRSTEERDLMVHLSYFPYVVEGAALGREPHRLTVYARELASIFHQFYHKHRIVTDDRDVSGSRLFLVQATQQVLKNALRLMGVGAPSSM